MDPNAAEGNSRVPKLWQILLVAVIAVAFVLWHRWRQYKIEREKSRTETQV